MIRNGFILFLILQYSVCAIAQTEAEELDSVAVYGFRIATPGVATLPKKRIEDRLAGDVGQLMTLFPGFQLRSYGGLGGLKTVSFRSLGANHTSVVVDRFALSQTQSGQTDLGQLPVDFLQQLAVVYDAGTSVSYPVHSKMAGVIIDVQTRHLPYNSDTFQLAAGTQLGSFGQRDAHLFLGFEQNKWRFAVSGKARNAEGNYPFSYMNGSNEINTTRKNGYLEDYYGTASVTFRPNEKNEIHLNGSLADFRKGLPGAVVFYNETSGQHLEGTNGLVNLRHHYKAEGLELATGISYQQNFLRYTDSTYLNFQGFLQNDYLSRQADAQSQLSFDLDESSKFLLGLEVRHEEMESENLNRTPFRNTTDFLLAYSLKKKANTLNIQFGATFMQQNGEQQNDFGPFYLQPMFDFTTRLSQTIGLSLGYRFTVRQPTFNELFYNQIGNSDLKAERAHLAWLRMDFGKRVGNHSIRAAVQPFYTYAKDKILAIPTKNLFVWSIRNLGRSDATGSEFTFNYAYILSKSTISLNLNYTLQYTRVFDDSDDTYSQMAYAPIHSGTSELSYERRKTGFSALMTYQGERYVLNQNIAANLTEDFILFDVSAYYRFYLGKRQSRLTVRAALNNITNNYYSYIRYFVMPGRNYTIRLTYDF